MTWILLALAAAFIWAVSNIVDKYLLSKWIDQPWLAALGFGVAALATSLVIFAVRGFGHLPFWVASAAMAAGAMYLLGEYFYYKGAQREEISRVISLVYLDALFTAMLSALFIGEIFSIQKYAGVCLLVAGAIVISYRPGERFRFKSRTAIWLCIVSAFFYALHSLLTKYSIDRGEFWIVFAYIRLGSFLAVLPLLPTTVKPLIRLAHKKPAVVTLLIANNIVVVIGALLFTWSASIGYVTLSASLSATQPFFVLLLTVIISRFYPKILKEESGNMVVAQKLLAMALMFGGILLIT